MTTDFVQVYGLARDREYIERIQKATVEASELALRTEHGLFGSAKWWAAIRDGTIPTQRLEGAIARVGRNAVSDWPEFEVESNGELSTWALEGDLSMYRAGKRVRIEYVTQRYQKPLPGSGEDSTRAVLGIWVER
jgi:hypothetical protein